MRIYLDFLVLHKAQSKQRSEHVFSDSVHTLAGHLTRMGPAVPLCAVWLLPMVALFQAYSNFSLEWSEHSKCLAVARMLAFLQNYPKSRQEAAVRLALSAFGRYWHWVR